MSKMLALLKVKKNSVLEAWQYITCAPFNQKVYFYYVFTFFVYVILSLGIDWPNKSRDPSDKTLILILKEYNVSIGFVVNLHCKLQFDLVRQLVNELEDISLLLGMIIFDCFS